MRVGVKLVPPGQRGRVQFDKTGASASEYIGQTRFKWRREADGPLRRAGIRAAGSKRRNRR